jgi:hypothetical protein
MSSVEHKLHNPGVKIYRIKGEVTDEDVEKLREELETFVKENGKRGACGILLDLIAVDAFSAEAIDALLELLSEPDDVIEGLRMRFALIGVKPFTQRFLREVMPLDPIKHIRARFFHEVAEEEALAWLQAMVSSADGETVAEKEEEKKKEEKETKDEKGEKKEKDEKKEGDEKKEAKVEEKKKPKAGKERVKPGAKPAEVAVSSAVLAASKQGEKVGEKKENGKPARAKT